MPVELEGLQQLMRQLEQMGRELDVPTKERALKAGGNVLKEEIKRHVPVRTGNWRENIIVSDIKDDTVDIGADQQGDAFYGHFYEFGTSKQPARPVYGPALDRKKEDTIEAMGESIKRDLGL